MRIDRIETPGAARSGKAAVDETAVLNRIELYFSLEELEDLCFGLGVSEKVAGATVRDRGRELIGFMSRRSRLHELLAALVEERPSVDWMI